MYAADFIEFIASHFSEIAVQALTVSELEEVIRHDSLKLNSENELFDILSRLVSNDGEYYALFRYIRFELLDLVNVRVFMDSLSNRFAYLGVSYAHYYDNLMSD